MAALLILGFLLGLKHALEADHVAAVASLATRSPRWTGVMPVAAAWGAGHALALIVCGSLLVSLDISLSPAASRALEALVGVMLVALGVDVLRRLRRKRIHFHQHEHEGRRHFHAHGHRRNAHDDHEHQHLRRLLPRALVVGSIHGLSGTAAVTLLSLEAIRSTAGAIFYLGLFGVGSILGMVLLSIVISLPFRFSAQRLTRFSNRIEGVLGSATIVLGGWILLQNAA